jgi:hypothetical protein
MNARKIGVMVLMVFSIFSGVALADPTYTGTDAGNTASAASQLEYPIPLNSWWLYAHGTLYPGSDSDDWYQLNTQSGEYLNYQLDLGDYSTTEQRIRDWANTATLGPLNSGKTIRLSGATKSWDHIIGIDSQNPEYEFTLKRTLS